MAQVMNPGAKALKKRKDNALDLWFKGGKADNYFKVTERGSNLTTELRAGCTTWLTAAYIFAVNPNILSVAGFNFEGLVFATAMSSFIATMIMGLWANLPFGLWPGMGMNAYFAYTVVGFKGTNHAAKKVMFAVMIEGVVFIIMSLLDLRRVIFKVFPTWLMKSTMAGIGLFLAFIGLQAGNGIDLIRGHPAILVDIVTLTGQHYARTFLGIFFFFVMATLVMLRVRGAVMIGILLSAFMCWILEATGTPQFVYQPKCCLGGVKMQTGGFWYPAQGSSYIGPEQMMPQPVCEGPGGTFEVSGTVSNSYTEPTGTADGFYSSVWSGSSATTGGFYNWTIDGTPVPGQALLFNGNGEGRNSLGFKGDCMAVCHAMFGGFNPECFGSVMVDSGCWTGMSYKEVGDVDNDMMHAMSGNGFNLAFGERVPSYTVIDAFGEGCSGGAGRDPQTFKAPTGFAAAPYAKLAKGVVPPYYGAFGCTDMTSCWAGNVEGGTIWAFDWDELDANSFWIPLLVLLYVDFIGTMGFLYAAADLSGLVDPAKPDNFPGCYQAFMADAVGTFVGGILGTSSVTTYGESMAGVYEGGRTGVTALMIAFLNFLAMFFAPFFSSIPTVSTGPALIMVGVFMIEGVKDIDWSDYMQAIPSMICILLQPVTYKIEVGVLAGFFCWAFMMIASLRFTLSFPGLFNSMPECLKSFVANQPLGATDLKKLEACGYAKAESTSTSTSAKPVDVVDVKAESAETASA